jgi:hypothetical protein
MKYTGVTVARKNSSDRYRTAGRRSDQGMPIRVTISKKQQTYNLTDLVARMNGRYPVYHDPEHIKNREKYEPKRKRRI